MKKSSIKIKSLLKLINIYNKMYFNKNRIYSNSFNNYKNNLNKKSNNLLIGFKKKTKI